MLRSILVGLDGSACGARTADLGIAWAREHDATLVGLGIVDEPGIRKPEPVPLGAGAFKEHRDEARLADARARVQRFLQEFAQRCAEVPVRTQTREATGQPSDCILGESQRCDLILLGQQTCFRFETQDRPDDTLQKVLHHCPRPVVAVPDREVSGGSVMLATDGSLQAARAVQLWQALGLHGPREVHVLSVAPDRAEAARHVQRVVEFLHFHGTAAHPHIVASSTPPAEVIRDQVRRLQAGLLVIGAYGQPAIREFFLGSVTRSLLKESDVPLFLYH